MAAAVGTAIATVAAGVFVATHAPRPHRAVERSLAPAPITRPAPVTESPVVAVSPAPKPPITHPTQAKDEPTRSGQRRSESSAPKPDRHDAPPAGHSPPPPTERTTPTPTPTATRPPGVAKGWDHRPPKDEHGHKTGWTKNAGKRHHKARA
jgi:hypothetical protein